ncbi:hypothetical protein NKH77_49125 [Streptomyces sp. M19]
MRAAVAVPAATGAATALGAGTAAATPGARRSAAKGGRFDEESPRFALAVLPDTQYLFDADSADPEPLTSTFRYLVAERGRRTSPS